ncbi:MAG: hypothetical protein ACE5IB_03890 [Candidatus Geothermarchaeales archaeon]
MRFPDSILAESAKGKEVRNLISRGGYVLHEYLGPETMKPLGKKKLYLKDDKGFSEAFFVIPLKGERSLLIKARETEEGRRIWNPTTEKTEDLWG